MSDENQYSYLGELAKIFNYVKYQNCRIEFYAGRFHVFGKDFDTWELAKKEVDIAKDALQKSIKK